LPFCSRCGRELLVNWEFCSHCGTSITAPLPIPTAVRIQAPKESHAARNILIVVAFVLMVLVLAAALSTPRQLTTPGMPSVPQLQEGGRVAIGQPFILRFGTDKVPVKVVFDSAKFTQSHEYLKADSGYTFLVLQLTLQNMGTKEVSTFSWLDNWEITVDKGYQYQARSKPSLNVRPEEKKTDYVVFEILQDTNPVEVKFYPFLSRTPDVILNFKGSVIEAGLSQGLLSIESREMPSLTVVTQRWETYR
jgi:hypothetical protein